MKPFRPIRSAYTMIEILIAVSLSMILVLAVAKLFQGVGTAMNNSQAAMMMGQNLNNVRFQLERDLNRRTIEIVKPSSGDLGYFSYTEGPMWEPSPDDPRLPNVLTDPWCSRNIAKDAANGTDDNTVGDLDDILALTVDGVKERGKMLIVEDSNSARLATAEAAAAEVIWFVRGNTLYRRVLLVGDFAPPGEVVNNLEYWMRRNRGVIGDAKPKCMISGNPVTVDRDMLDNAVNTGEGFHAFFDVSVRKEATLAPNKIYELARRENRYGNYHRPFPFNPHDTRGSGDADSGYSWYPFGLPTLKETSSLNWPAGSALPNLGNPAYGATTAQQFYQGSPPGIDYWGNPISADGPNGWNVQVDANGVRDNTLAAYHGPRYTEDVILTNVIAFDVKAWDETQGRFIDLGEAGLNTAPRTYPLASKGAYATEADWGNHPVLGSGFKWNADANNPDLACVYDTWTDEYETDAKSDSNTAANVGQLVLPYFWDGSNKSGPLRPSASSFPDPAEPDKNNWACPPPYGNTPLPGVQVTIRTFDPRSGHIREVKHVANLRY